MTAPVDVLAVLREYAQDTGPFRVNKQGATNLAAACAAIAELIEAAEWMSAYFHADSGVDRVIRLRAALAAVSPK